jgi:hypothetical protein
MNKVVDTDKSNFMVNEFIKKIYDLDKSKNTLEEKITSIDNLLNNLIDYCIKKKIFYFVENKISYSNITINFKFHLIKFIKNLIDPSDNIIKKYIGSNTINNDTSNNTKKYNNPNWDNVSDINSLMFKNFKQLNESFEKNVSFQDNFQITNYDDGDDGFECNIKSSNINSNLLNIANSQDEDINNELDIKNLSLYIKILVNQNKYLVEFIDKLTQMCKILSDTEIKYKKSNPFDK